MKDLTLAQNTNFAVDDELIQQFNQSQKKNEIAEVLHELFDKGKIYMIGDLTIDEIKLMTKIYMIAKIKNIDCWNELLIFYCTATLSKDRKSRRELINAITGIQQQQGIFGKLFNPINRT